MILAMGDSHVFCLRGCPEVDVYHLGPGTAYRLLDERSTTQAGEAVRNLIALHPNEDAYLLSFGEIDCRIHIRHQAAKTGTSIPDLIWRTVTRYDDFVRDLECGSNLLLLGIPPAGTAPNHQEIYLNQGSQKEKGEVFRSFDRAMRWVFKRQYVSIIERFGLPDGTMDPAWAADNTHLNAEAGKIIVQLCLDRLKGK